MSLAREWTAFAGAVFALMGASLAGGARRSAEDALSWERQWRGATGAPEPERAEEERRARWTSAYRAGGAAFLMAGAWLLVRAAVGMPLTVRESPLDALAGGLFFTACGGYLALNAWRRRRGLRLPGFLLGDPLAAAERPSAGEVVALWCSRSLVALFVAFGLRLLSEARG